MDTEFQFGRMKNFWKWMVVMVVQCVDIYNAIVLNIYWKMFKMVNFMLYIFTTIKNE